MLRDVQTSSPEKGRRLINDAMTDDLAAVLTESEVESVRARMLQVPRRRSRARLRRPDYMAAFGVFLLGVPLDVSRRAAVRLYASSRAFLRVSNLIAVIMLFLTGCAYGKFAGGTPWQIGAVMVVIGLCMVALTIALGG